MTNEARQSNSPSIWTVLKYAASIGILVLLIYKYRDQFAVFVQSPIHYGWFALALFTMLAAFLCSYIRWQQLASAIGLELTVLEAMQLGFIGSFFNIVTIGVVGGDSLRAFYAARNSSDKGPSAVLSVFLDRVIGLIVMCGFAAVAYSLVGIPGEKTSQKKAIEFVCTFAGFASALGCVALLVMLFVPNLKYWKAVSWVLKLNKIGPLFERVMDAAALYNRRKLTIIKAMLLSVFTNCLFSITIFSVASSITQDPPSQMAHFVIAPIAMVANAIPLPGGIGGMEAALAHLYPRFEGEGGFVVALGFRLCILSVSLIGWIVWLRTSSKIKNASCIPTTQ